MKYLSLKQKEKLCTDIDNALIGVKNTALKYYLETPIRYPAEDFEQEIKVTGLSYKYNLPKELSDKNIEGFTCFYADIIFAHNGSNDPTKRQRAGKLQFTEKEIRQEYFTQKEFDIIEARPLPYTTLLPEEISQWKTREEKHIDNVNKLWQWLVELNPILNDIKFDTDNFFAVESAVFGVTSRYNPDDIQHYIDKFYGTIEPADQKDSNKLYNEIQKSLGPSATYEFLSIPSLKKIKAQLPTRQSKFKPPTP